MFISYSQLPAFVRTFQDASREDKTWVAIDAQLQMPTVGDLHFYDTREQADDFVQFNQSQGREIALLPVEASRFLLHESAKQHLQEGLPASHIELNIVEAISIHDEMIFQNRLAVLEELMDGFDWSTTFYDPFDPIVDEMKIEERIAYNRLAFLVEDLSSFAQTDERGQSAVRDLTRRHWANVAMESQIENILNGNFQLKNESKYQNYGIDSDENPLHNKDGNEFTEALIDHWESQQFLNNKTNFMNQQNLDYLKDNIKYTGFGEALYPELEKNMKEGKPEFQLHFTTQLNNRPFNATLFFRKSDSADRYFFNSYKASYERSNGEKMEQSFPIKKGKGITAKEAYNLLQGRAVYKEMVNKENEPYKAWVHLDFDNKDKYGNYEVLKKHDNYGYDLRASIDKFPIKELDGGEKEKELLRSLEKGNAQAVTMEIGGKEEKMFIEANPAYKTINVYDSGFVLQKHETLPVKEQANEQAARQESKHAAGQEQKQGEVAQQERQRSVGQEQKQGEAKSAARKNGKNLSGKKRTAKQKGIAIN
jgi:hypothetical protein